VGGEGDVDPLRVAARRVDAAIVDRHPAPADVDAVERRADDADPVEGDVVRAVHLDAILAAERRDVADDDVARPDDDPAADDGAARADEVLPARTPPPPPPVPPTTP